MTDPPLAVLDTGGDLPAVVFVHGLTFTKETWEPILERLEGEFRCVAVDLPGHGASHGSGADPQGVADRIAATLAARSVARPVVVGHSYGALHATIFGADHAASGVVNVDQSLRVGPFAGLVQGLAPGLRGPDFGTAFAPFTAAIGVGRLPSPERERVLATQHVDQGVVLDYWSKPLATPPAALQAEVDAILDRTNIPYLWLTGEPVADADRHHLLAHIAHAQVETWPGLGHTVHLADPDGFAERVGRFVRTSA